MKVFFKKIKLIPVAATIALIIFFGTNFLLNNNSELSSDEIVNWVDMNINTISSDDITIAFTDVNFDNINPYVTIKSEDIIESLINSDDIDFLIEDANINEIN
jgi:catabolite regulation protein CreA